jgi:Uncharacterized protein conserved in bacteria
MAEYITCNEENGSINISEDVIAVIVAAAAVEVEGVSGLAHTAGQELYELFGKKSISKGIKVQFDEKKIIIDTIILVRAGFAITNVAKKVQDAVANAVESMTGLGIPTVNVHVSGVTFDK